MSTSTEPSSTSTSTQVTSTSTSTLKWYLSTTRVQVQVPSTTSLVRRTSDLCSTGCEFNYQPCAAVLVLRRMTICGWETILVCNQLPRSTQPSVWGKLSSLSG